MGLSKYHAKRDFKETPEPRGKKGAKNSSLSFVVQKHHARRLHYDFRLEFDGVLKSWAVPKGPSLDPKDKRLAVEVEDHPIDYANFEGDIPEGHYGAGHVIVWDEGTWKPLGNVRKMLAKGHLEFEMTGEKLNGKFTLVRLKGKGERQNNWLLFKKNDEHSVTGSNIVEERPESVKAMRGKKKKSAAKSSKTVASPKLKKEKLPVFIKPQLAQLVDKVPAGDNYLHEIKFDGYRTQARIDGKKVKLLTRSGLDWTKKYGPISAEFLKLKVKNAIIDGELIWTDEKGRADFQGLQNALSEDRYDRMVFYAFDILHLDGGNLKELPLEERKDILAKILKKYRGSKILLSEHWRNKGQAMFQQSCKLGLEGIISKEASQPYLSGRSEIWQKTKCSLRQEFVIGGYVASAKDGRDFRSLLLGAYEDGELKYAGRVGTGFSATTFEDLSAKFNKLETKVSPFKIKSPKGRDIHFLKPKLAGEVEFKGWTGEGVLRHASFYGLRTDKSVKLITKEKPQKKTKTSRESKSSLKITHPERVIYPKSKVTKADVLSYYDAVKKQMWPFVQDRPLSILRCQTNVKEGCFFQKHDLAGLEDQEVHYKDKKGQAISVSEPDDILKIVQNGGIEIHGWGAQFANITKPDLMVFDLDPESSALWKRVVETAHEIREKLQTLGLESFPKVTGGKGLHIQVPIRPVHDWETIKNFTHSLMKVLEHEAPEKFTTNMIKTKRKGRIFLDYLRNGYGATAIVPYSVRAREQPTVALPISWKEVKVSLSPDQYTIQEVVKMLKRRKDPWKGYWELSQKIKVLDGVKKAKISDLELSL